MKREDDRRNPLRADALRGFFEFVKGIFLKWIKGKNAHWKQVIIIFVNNIRWNNILEISKNNLH